MVVEIEGEFIFLGEDDFIGSASVMLKIKRAYTQLVMVSMIKISSN